MSWMEDFVLDENLGVHSSGEEKVDPKATFREMGLISKLVAILEGDLKYKSPTSIQKAAIPAVLAGRNVLAASETGSGKTSTYVIPITNCLEVDEEKRRQWKVLILVPTRELALQVAGNIRTITQKLGSKLRCISVYGKKSRVPENLARGGEIIVATPGRLLNVLKYKLLTLQFIEFMVIDEADRMLEMDFEKDMNTILEYRTKFKEPFQTLMFSATYPRDVKLFGEKYLKNPLLFVVGELNKVGGRITQEVLEVKNSEKHEKLLEALKKHHDETTLVFVETRKKVIVIRDFLHARGFSVIGISGAFSQFEREAALDDFQRERIQILVATNVAARGLHIQCLRHVIVYDISPNANEYINQVGRTGRTGMVDGYATVFFDPNREHDQAVGGVLARALSANLQEVPLFLQKLYINAPVGKAAIRNMSRRMKQLKISTS